MGSNDRVKMKWGGRVDLHTGTPDFSLFKKMDRTRDDLLDYDGDGKIDAFIRGNNPHHRNKDTRVIVVNEAFRPLTRRIFGEVQSSRIRADEVAEAADLRKRWETFTSFEKAVEEGRVIIPEQSFLSEPNPGCSGNEINF